MALPITIPYTFATATTSIPLANLDSDFTTVTGAINGIYDGTNALLSPTLGNASATTLSASASILSTGTLGYKTGAGGTITQATSKSTGVTLNKICGYVITANSALATNTAVSFALTNSFAVVGDVVIANLVAGYTNHYDYNITAGINATGTVIISIRNVSGASLSQAIRIQFAIIKSVTA
jgi:hypothetical protein